MLNFNYLALIGGCLAMALTSGAVWADSSTARSRTKQLIIQLDNTGLRQAQTSSYGHTATDLRLPDGRQVRVLRSFSGDGLVVELPEEVSLEEAGRIAQEMSSRTGIISVQPDKRYFPAFIPNDPEFPASPSVQNPHGQWHLFELTAGIGMPAAWDVSTGSAGVVVAVIDTGIVPHRDLDAGRILAGYDFYSDVVNDNDGMPGRDANPTDPGDWTNAGECGPGDPEQDEDSSWHGLTVAGVIVASSDNATDIAGIDYAVNLLPIRVLGKCGGSLSDVADAIRWAAGYSVTNVPPNPTPADVINLSLGGEGPCSQAEQSAINDAVAAGSVVVVAGGNGDGTNVADVSPPNCDNVIVTGAIARDGSIASYTNVGLAVDLTAPGGDGPTDESNILTLFNAGTTFATSDELAFVQGTSFTAAEVSGVASLMLAVNPALTPSDLEDVIKASTRDFPNPSCDQSLCGTGLLNAEDALLAAQDPSDIQADQPPVAVAGGPYTGSSSQATVFDGSGSFDPESGSLTYSWDFGDDNFGTGVAASHTYDAVPATYTVSLTVNDGVKDSEVSVTTVTIDGGQKTVNSSGGGSCTLHTSRSGKSDLLWWLALTLFAHRLVLSRKYS
jgi:serine protease